VLKGGEPPRHVGLVEKYRSEDIIEKQSIKRSASRALRRTEDILNS
jgi:hypothetical protein